MTPKVIKDLYVGLKFEIEYYVLIVLVYYAVFKKTIFMLPTLNHDCYSSPKAEIILDEFIILIIFAPEIISDIVADFVAFR